MKFTHDAVVVGAGPAGASAAHHLKRCGVGRVLVLERMSERAYRRYHSICGEAVSAGSLRRAGIEPREAVCRIDHIELGVVGKEGVSIPADGYIIDRSAMTGRLLSESGAERIRATVLSARAADGGYEVESTAGTFSAPVLIGADGAHSVVRKCIFGSSPEEFLTIENCLMPGDRGSTLRFDVGAAEGSYSWEFPSSGGKVSVGSV